ncbi:MAG: hypothetical protein KDN19_23750, partial [Verrucomicrobiae bacterium]|nr:hypothetical protein [Verrucomicrobiae bacterium]
YGSGSSSPAIGNSARWRATWTVLAAGFAIFLFFAGGPRHLVWPLRWATRAEVPTIIDRGDFHWIVYPEGRSLKLDRNLPVPDQFPEPTNSR